MSRYFLIACFLLVASTAVPQPVTAAPDSEVRAFLANFIRSFGNLDWEGFRKSFADDATVFYPRAFPQRASGRSEYEKTFRLVFEQIRGNQKAAPFMDIQPIDMQVQIYGEVAIATFHLDDRVGFLNRRTIVLRRSEGFWKIVHLHASEVAVEH